MSWPLSNLLREGVRRFAAVKRPVGFFGVDIPAPKQSLGGIWEVGGEMVGARVGDGWHCSDYCKCGPTRSTFGEVGGYAYTHQCAARCSRPKLGAPSVCASSRPSRLSSQCFLARCEDRLLF